MKSTWKPAAAGIICIVAGVFTVFGVFVLAMVLVGASGGLLAFSRAYAMMPLWLSGFLQGAAVIIAIFVIVASALPIIGGAFALQRKEWGWALGGAIVAFLGTALPGIAAIVLLALSRSEFQKKDRFR